MTTPFSLPRHLTFDSQDAYALSRFWSAVTGWPNHPDDKPGDPEALLQAPDGVPGLLFVTVPESKTVKNRVHLDLQPQNTTRDAEVERLLTLGATVYEDHRKPDGTGWVTMRDPEGNELCVERSAAERAATDH